MVTGKTRSDLGELSLGEEVQIIVNDDGSYGTVGTRVVRIDTNGQKWVKLNGEYWKYPQQVDH